MKCSIDTCERKQRTRSYCSAHYSRFLRHGSALGGALDRVNHGLRNTRQYSVWHGIKQRCLNPNDPAFRNYGGRGIELCDEWKHSFMSFYSWAMKNGYQDDLTIDRKDTDGNYEPGNCTWSTRKEQQNNLRNNTSFVFKGKRQTIHQWAAEINISPRTLQSRVRYGWSTERLLTTPPDPRFRAKDKEASRA